MGQTVPKRRSPISKDLYWYYREKLYCNFEYKKERMIVYNIDTNTLLKHMREKHRFCINSAVYKKRN